MRRNLIGLAVFIVTAVLILWGNIVLQVELLREVDYPWSVPIILICTIFTVLFVLVSGYLLNQWANREDPEEEDSDDEDVE